MYAKCFQLYALFCFTLFVRELLGFCKLYSGVGCSQNLLYMRIVTVYALFRLHAKKVLLLFLTCFLLSLQQPFLFLSMTNLPKKAFRIVLHLINLQWLCLMDRSFTKLKMCQKQKQIHQQNPNKTEQPIDIHFIPLKNNLVASLLVLS